jgi:zinc transporter, ZIP family
LDNGICLLLIAMPFAVLAGVLGGVGAYYWDPSTRWRGYVQHLAAGILTAVIAIDVLPEALGDGDPPFLILGFAFGSLVMMGLRFLSQKLEKRKDNSFPYGLTIASVLDTTIDGMIIGVGFTVSTELGITLVIGLAIDLSVLTLSVGSEFRKEDVSKRNTLLTTSGIAVMVAVGAVLGYLVFSGMEPNQTAVVLAFSAAALLYLVTEELLAKGHSARQSTGTVFFFFLGFIALMAFTLFFE